MAKVVVCGAGFLGSNIARHIAASSVTPRKVQISSRNPSKVYENLRNNSEIDKSSLLAPVAVDITRKETLSTAFENASVVVALVGIMHGAPSDFERIQHKGAENVAIAARNAGAKLIHMSAIGADKNSSIPYAKTKGLGEEAVLHHNPEATIIRPSLVFGPGDGFFARFATLSSFLPFLPVFAGGQTKFQPVYVGDIARLVEIISRDDPKVRQAVEGKVVEAGGPEVFTYYDMMSLVLEFTGRYRPIISLPYSAGMLQGLVMEKLPENLLTLTRAQVEQLKSDNVITSPSPSFKEIVESYSDGPLSSVRDILPTYLSH